jgi:SAM-dependent methyltransferase
MAKRPLSFLKRLESACNLLTLSPHELRNRLFPGPHPYAVFEHRVRSLIHPGSVILDAGCGRGAPTLRALQDQAARLIGIDPVAIPELDGRLEIKRGSLEQIELPDRSLDLVYSRCVMEHLENPPRVYREINRVLKPGSHFVFLTPNIWDYGSIVARMIPNRFHPAIVRRTEGRREEDTFPTFYRSNSVRRIRKLARDSGFHVVSSEYLGQYPSYLMFSSPLFLLGTGYERLISAFRPLHFLSGWLLAILVKAPGGAEAGGKQRC